MNLMLLAAACLVGLRAASQATYGIPIVTWPPLLEPRYFAEASFAVAKRDGQCDKGSHNCLDVNHDGQCCENDTYCYIDKTNALRCCPIGSNCVDNSPCKSDSFFCRRTVDTNLAGTALATPTLQDGCCQRLCPQTSHYLCARSLGGKCCPYGAECQVGGNCLLSETPATTATRTTDAPLLATPAAGGCSTGQSRCADGTGCCDAGKACTRVAGTPYCAAPNPTPGPGGSLNVTYISADAGLSTGARAGIGVGAALGLGILVGALAWLCMSSRRRGAARRAARDAKTPADETEMNAMRRPRLGHGLTEDYFGPSPVTGPYTDTALSSEHVSPGLERAVPPQPRTPGDIAAPVEMDSSAAASRGSRLDEMVSAPQTSNTVEGRFELYGSQPETPIVQSTSQAHMQSPPEIPRDRVSP